MLKEFKEFNVFNLFSNELEPCEVCGKKTTKLLDTYICHDCLKQLLKAGVVFLKKVNECVDYATSCLATKDENPLNENGGLE